MLLLELRSDKTDLIDATSDSGVRPSLMRGPRVGRHAAITEQHGSIRDQMKMFAIILQDQNLQEMVTLRVLDEGQVVATTNKAARRRGESSQG